MWYYLLLFSCVRQTCILSNIMYFRLVLDLANNLASIQKHVFFFVEIFLLYFLFLVFYSSRKAFEIQQKSTKLQIYCYRIILNSKYSSLPQTTSRESIWLKIGTLYRHQNNIYPNIKSTRSLSLGVHTNHTRQSRQSKGGIN